MFRNWTHTTAYPLYSTMMCWIYFTVLSAMVVDLTMARYSDIQGLPQRVYQMKGDIMIGGVFPLHQSGPNGTFCGKLRELGVLQRAEAMAFYIQQVNNDENILPGIKLGFTILDDCYKETTALAQGLQFIPQGRYTDDVTNDTHVKPKEDVVAVIGAESSTNSKQLAELLGLFQVPQISYLSTSPTLGDRIAYPYFTRTVPSDKYQIDAIIHLLEHFKWSYVSFVFSFDFYGLDAFMLMNEGIKNSTNICMAASVNISPNPGASDFKTAVDELERGSNNKPSHVVILFLSQTSATGILKEAHRRHLTGNFTWIASDAWGRNEQDFRDVQDIAEGTLTMKIKSTNREEFDRHFEELSLKNKTDHPYLEEFMVQACSKSKESCTDRTKFKDIPSVYQPESTVGLVEGAVKILVYALDELLKRCRRISADGACDGFQFRQFINGSELQQRIRGTSGCLGTTCFSVDREGEGRSPYTIMNYHTDHRTGFHVLKPIGSYDTFDEVFKMTREQTDIGWNSKIDTNNIGDGGVPLSICSKECEMGQSQTRSGYENSKCCWTCTDCGPKEYTNVTKQNGLQTFQCAACGTQKKSDLLFYMAPNNDKDGCDQIPPKSIDPSNPAAAVILTLAIVCCAATIVLLVIYVRNRTHRLIKATSLELSYIIWTGVILSYFSIIFYFLPLHHGCTEVSSCNPHLHTHWCYIQFITFSLCFTIINAPMLTRVNRIYRIFTKGKKSAIKPRFIENKYQLIIVAILVSGQVAVIMICCFISAFSGLEETIKVNNYHEDDQTEYSSLVCDIPYSLLLPPVIYNLLLGVACAYHAFTTRKLPDNFNESRFIGLTVYTTVIMWIAFIPAYIVINAKLYKGVPLSAALLINAVITTGCLFVPRLYALRWIEGGKMNLRSLSISVNSLSDKRRSSVTDVGSFDRIRAMSNGSQKTKSTLDGRSSDSGIHSSSTTKTAYMTSADDISRSIALQEMSSSSSPGSEYDPAMSFA